MIIESLFTRSWYAKSGWTQCLKPILPLVSHIVNKKRQNYLDHPADAYKAPVPVLVVGNISVGGTGKSPMVIALCRWLTSLGYKIGIVSRGHGAKLSAPTFVTTNSHASEVGDEPVMLARRTACPLVVFAKRDLAVKTLLSEYNLDLIICDDGMQHYRLARDIEIAMLDAKRGLGNGYLLPVGPLREPKERLASVDYLVTIGESQAKSLTELNLPVLRFSLTSKHLVSLDESKVLSFQEAFKSNRQWHLMAGIGNPERFVDTLAHYGLQSPYTRQWFGDHHGYDVNDFNETNGPILMTEKDAVKCKQLPLNDKEIWFLPIDLALSESFKSSLLAKINSLQVGMKNE
ncbi:tetraacyldisaccharide 4'-kinase [Marinomonas epiphytica]